jgi:hypothetical protein
MHLCAAQACRPEEQSRQRDRAGRRIGRAAEEAAGTECEAPPNARPQGEADEMTSACEPGLPLQGNGNEAHYWTCSTHRIWI